MTHQRPAIKRPGFGRYPSLSPLAETRPPATCQWIEGEPRERAFCGAPVKPGSSYCEEHHALCWRPAAEKGA